MQVVNEQYKEKCFALEGEVAGRIEEGDYLQRELRNKDEMMDKMFLTRGAEGALRVEVE